MLNIFISCRAVCFLSYLMTVGPTGLSFFKACQSSLLFLFSVVPQWTKHFLLTSFAHCVMVVVDTLVYNDDVGVDVRWRLLGKLNLLKRLPDWLLTSTEPLPRKPGLIYPLCIFVNLKKESYSFPKVTPITVYCLFFE